MTAISNNNEQVINFNSSENTNSRQNEHHEIIDYDNNICDAVNCNNHVSITLILPIAGTNNRSESSSSITLQICKDCKSKFE